MKSLQISVRLKSGTPLGNTFDSFRNILEACQGALSRADKRHIYNLSDCEFCITDDLAGTCNYYRVSDNGSVRKVC